MKSGSKKFILTHVDVLAVMEADVPYTLHEIARLLNAGVPAVQAVLTRCVAEGQIVSSYAGNGKRKTYQRTNGCVAAKRATLLPPTRPLEGYDAQHRQFRELCMSARAPQPPGQIIRYGVMDE